MGSFHSAGQRKAYHFHSGEVGSPLGEKETVEANAVWDLSRHLMGVRRVSTANYEFAADVNSSEGGSFSCLLKGQNFVRFGVNPEMFVFQRGHDALLITLRRGKIFVTYGPTIIRLSEVETHLKGCIDEYYEVMGVAPVSPRE